MDENIQIKIDEYKKILEADPKNRVFLDLAQLYHKAGFTNEAINACKKGLELRSDYIDARIFLSKIWIEKNMMKEAKEELDKVLIVDPVSILANTMLEMIYRYEGREEDANKIRGQIFSLQQSNFPEYGKDKKSVETSTAAEIYVSQGLIDEAIKIYENIALSNPMDVPINNRLKELREKKEEQYIDFQKKRQKIKETLYKLQEDIKQMQDRIQNLEKEI